MLTGRNNVSRKRKENMKNLTLTLFPELMDSPPIPRTMDAISAKFSELKN